MRNTNRRPMIEVATLMFCLLTAHLLFGQDAGTVKAKPSTAPATAKTQSAPAETTKNSLDVRAALEKQQEVIEEMSRAISQMRAQIQTQQEEIQRLRSSSPSAAANQVASTTPVLPATAAATPSSTNLSFPTTTTAAASNPQGGSTEEPSPLQFHIGSAYVTPVGFMDFTSVWRSKDGGSGIGTNFAGIPYGNSFQTNLSEFRLSMQNSRVGFRVDADVKGAHVIGYMESDFLGNNPGNVAVSSNSNTLRSRLYWVDVRKDQWEVLGGQTWSLITPNRSGISPLPGDVFFTQNMDVNYQIGLVWGRIPELRVVYHPSSKAAFAVALDSPEQYIGGSAGGGLITLPSGLSSTYSSELNNGGNTLGVPNRAPDVIVKFAFDPTKKIHFEVGGVVRQFHVFNPATSTHYSAAGGGGFANLNFELFKGFRLLTNNFWSDGGGRYIFGQAPDLVVRANGAPSLVHSGSTVTGFEYTNHNTLIFGYYGGMYVGRNTGLDANGTSLIGYGYSGSPNGQNRVVQEATVGFNQTFWKDAKYGALNLIGQYSYVTRDPWAVATGQPSNASLHMVFLDLRYTLPGSAPTLGK